MVFGRHAPLCWRCAAMALAIAMSAAPLGMLAPGPGPMLFGIALCVPAAIDGWRSYFTRAGTSNRARAMTGLLLGFGLALVAAAVGPAGSG